MHCTKEKGAFKQHANIVTKDNSTKDKSKLRPIRSLSGTKKYEFTSATSTRYCCIAMSRVATAVGYVGLGRPNSGTYCTSVPALH